MHSSVLSTVVLICNSPSWHSELLQSMPSSPHLLNSCTNTSLGPSSLPKCATLMQQPSKFVNRLTPVPMPSDHRLINTANHLHPCVLVSAVAMYDNFCKIWVPDTVVHVLPKDSYHVHTSNGTVYHCTR